MLAIIALVCFVLAAFDAKVGSLTTINILSIGLAFLAAHLIYPWTPWNDGRRSQ